MLRLIACGLAAWRVSHILVYEAGPYRIFVRIRSLFGIQHEDDVPISWPPNCLLSCVWCVSVWVAAALWLVPTWVSFILAASAIACIVEAVNGKS